MHYVRPLRGTWTIGSETLCCMMLLIIIIVSYILQKYSNLKSWVSCRIWKSVSWDLPQLDIILWYCSWYFGRLARFVTGHQNNTLLDSWVVVTWSSKYRKVISDCLTNFGTSLRFLRWLWFTLVNYLSILKFSSLFIAFDKKLLIPNKYFNLQLFICNHT